MNDTRINLQTSVIRAGKAGGVGCRKDNVYLVHTHAVQRCHSHWGQLVAIVSQAQLSIAIIAPAIHLRERRGEDKLWRLPRGRAVLSYTDQILQNLYCTLRDPTSAIWRFWG